MFDYQDARVGGVSVGDLLDFDRLMERLGDAERMTVLRKIKHEINTGDAAIELENLHDRIEDGYGRSKAKNAEIADLTEQRTQLQQRVDTLVADNALLASQLLAMQNDRESQLVNAFSDGHAAGYARGREDAAA